MATVLVNGLQIPVALPLVGEVVPELYCFAQGVISFINRVSTVYLPYIYRISTVFEL